MVPKVYALSPIIKIIFVLEYFGLFPYFCPNCALGALTNTPILVTSIILNTATVVFAIVF